MGELKTRSREAVNENQDKYNEIYEKSEDCLEERNNDIFLEGIDDDDKYLIENGKIDKSASDNDIATSGEDIKEKSNDKIDDMIDTIMQQMKEEW